MSSAKLSTLDDESSERAAWEVANPLTLIGGNRPYHVMSVLLAEHSHSRGILGFVTYEDANSLRSVCKELRDEVAGFRWKDMSTRINGRLDLWRKCFPHGVSANLANRVDLRKSDFRSYLCGILHLDISGPGMVFHPSSFVYIAGIQSLNISSYRHMEHKPYGRSHLEHLRGIKSLNISSCTINEFDIALLKGIHTLNISHCSRISGRDFVHLEGIHTLDISGLMYATFGEDFRPLKGSNTLNISGAYLYISDDLCTHLDGIQTLIMNGCNQASVDVTFGNLIGIKALECEGCRPSTRKAAQRILNASRLLRSEEEIDYEEVDEEDDYKQDDEDEDFFDG